MRWKVPNNETEFGRWIDGAAKSLGGKCTKLHGHSMQRSGISDLWFVIPASLRTDAIHGWLELKVGNNQLSMIQSVFLEEVRSGECIGLCVTYCKGVILFSHSIDVVLGEFNMNIEGDITPEIFWGLVRDYGRQSLEIERSGF